MMTVFLGETGLPCSADTFFVMENGLKVIMVPQQGLPAVAVRLVVKAGSASETRPDEHGLAHLVEHMVFKGTPSRGAEEITFEVERFGGDLNAYTDVQETCYHTEIPSEGLEAALGILADFVFRPAFDPEEFALEKEVVLEELRQDADCPEVRLCEAFYEDCFGKGHPLAHPVLGSTDSVSAASLGSLKEFHRRHYRPDNTFLVIAGGFDPGRAARLAERFFGEFLNPGFPLVRPAAPAQPAGGPVVRVLRHPLAKMPMAVMGFRSPPVGDPWAPAVDLMVEILGSGISSRLNEVVSDRLGLAPEISCRASAYDGAGAFMIEFRTDPEKIVAAVGAVVGELLGLSASPPGADELARVKAMAAMGFLEDQEDAESLAESAVSFELAFGDFRLKDAYPGLRARTGAGDLARLAATIFVPEGLSIAVLLPEDAPVPDEAAVFDAARRLAGRPPGASASPAARPSFEETALACGARMVAAHDPALPLVEMRVSAFGGGFAEHGGREGLMALMADVWGRATGKRSAPELARTLEGRGSSLDGVSGRDTTGLVGTFLKDHWREGAGLLVEVLTDPAFGEEDFERARDEFLAEAREAEEDLEDRSYRLACREVFRDHPYAGDRRGTVKSLGSLTLDDAREAYRSLARPESLVFAVGGDLDPAEAADALNEALASWCPPSGGHAAELARETREAQEAQEAQNTQAEQETQDAQAEQETQDTQAAHDHLKPLPPYVVHVPQVPPELSGPVIVSEVAVGRQCRLTLAFLVPGDGHRDEAALDVLDAIFSGAAGGILFAELREKRPLAYDVSSTYIVGRGTGFFGFFIGCAPEKVAKAMDGLAGIVSGARDGPFTADRTDAAKTYLAGCAKIDRQTLYSRVSDAAILAHLGLGQDRNERYLEEIAAVGPDDVLRVAREYLSPSRAVLAAVGSPASIRAAERRFAAFVG
ncbi:MAG: insulinase family protein [Deltaproteobacteria bacterium]|jgi:zinc protease|nr:insulinase family protein [Deltaproteobacteria bacterium]